MCANCSTPGAVVDDSAIPVTNVRANDTHRLIPSKYSASKYGETRHRPLPPHR